MYKINPISSSFEGYKNDGFGLNAKLKFIFHNSLIIFRKGWNYLIFRLKSS
jgi:hypothetical protein